MRDYLYEIARAKTAEEAAILVRALATRHAAGLTCYSDRERVAIIEQAERNAQTLERPWSEDGRAASKPWRRWLREWGYRT